LKLGHHLRFVCLEPHIDRARHDDPEQFRDLHELEIVDHPQLLEHHPQGAWILRRPHPAQLMQGNLELETSAAETRPAAPGYVVFLQEQYLQALLCHRSRGGHARVTGANDNYIIVCHENLPFTRL